MYSYMDPGTPADVASKILAYSREVQIAKVIEVIGGKDERAKRLLSSYLNKMDFNDCNLEMSMRRFLTTFRLAGVDSQVVNRLIEQFSFAFHAKDNTKLFLTKEEAHDFAYLLIVLQTSQHNPSIKSKIDMKSFLDQALINLPKSKEQLPPLYLESIYHSVTNTSFFTPLSRSLFEEGYNEYNRVEVGIRLSQVA
jgi:Sec7-like guanine-nucleotide exchange factor